MPVALKIALFASDPRFEREAGLLARFQHPAMPRLLDRGLWHASQELMHPYFAMEWIRGRPLYDWARQHPPSSRQVLQVVAQMAWGLEVLHRAGCLHRDIKGDNILVEPEGRAVITDFGSGTWAGAAPLTERLMAPGTREYRSPEALWFEWEHWEDRKARYEARAADDTYALGVSVYRLLTEVYPPPPIDPEELKGLPVVPPPPRAPLREMNERVVPELAALVERMLSRQPEARGTGRELAEAAESAAERLGSAADVPCLKQAVAASVAVPVRIVSLPPSRGPAAESVAVPVRASVKRRAHSWARWPMLGAAAMILTMLGIWGVGHWQDEEAPQVERTRTRGGGMAPKAGTRGLGDSTATTRVAAQGAPGGSKSEAIAEEMPDQPLPRQRRAPCRGRGEVAINGGCWRKLDADTPAPCPDDAYEWKGVCYYPIIERVRPRTSKKLR